MECDGAVAADRVGFNKGGTAGRGKIGVAVPDIAVASVDGFDASAAVVDSKVECGGRVAALGVGKDDRIDSRDSVDRIMPELLVAGGDSLGTSSTVVEGEVERDGGVAATGVGEDDRIDSGGCVERVVPEVLVAGNGVDSAGGAMIDNQM